MTRSNGFTKALLVSVLLLACGFHVTGSAKADDALNMVPSNSLFCVRINNLDGALGQVDLFLTGLFPMGVSMPVKAQLGQILGSTQPQGINTAGSFTVFGPLPGGAGPDHRDPVAVVRGRVPQNFGIPLPGNLVGDIPLEPADGDSLAPVGDGTDVFTLVGADPSADRREGVGHVEVV